MCVESALGITGIIGGLGILGFGLGLPVSLRPAALAACVGVMMVAGFLIKDLVLEWSPFRIYREANHAQVIFRWRE